MSECDSLTAIVADMRSDAEAYHDAWLNDPNESPESDAVSNVLANYARRIEAAWKREKAEWESAACDCVSEAVMSGTVAVEHVPVCNAAAMREAMEEISSVSLGNFKEPIDGDSSNLYQDARYKGDKFVGVALPAWVAVDWYRKLKAVKEKAKAALSAPARNCDRQECATSKAAQDVWRKEDGGKTPYYEWLLAPATKKGEGDGR